MSLKNKKVDVEKIIENPVARTDKPSAPKENIWGWLAYVLGQAVIGGGCLVIAGYILYWLDFTVKKESLYYDKSLYYYMYICVLYLGFFVGILLFPICAKMDIRKQQINISKSVNRIILVPYIITLGLITTWIITSIFNLEFVLVFQILFMLNTILYIFSVACYIWTKHKLGYRCMIVIIMSVTIFIVSFFFAVERAPPSNEGGYYPGRVL